MHISPPSSFPTIPTIPTIAARLAAIALALAVVAPVATAQKVTHSPTLSAGLYEIVFNDSTNTVYTASAGSRAEPGGKILALDPVSLAVRSTIDVSSAPAYGLAINNRTQTLYTTNTRNGDMSAINLRTGKVTTIRAANDSSAHLFRVLVDEEANKVYAAVAAKPGRVWVVDGATNTLEREIGGVGETATSIALDRGAQRLYVTSLGTNEVITVDLKTNQVISRIDAGGKRPTQSAFDEATGRLFVTNQETGNLSVLDMRAGKLLRTIPTGQGALGIGFNAATNHVYVANRMAGTVTVIDAASYAVLNTIEAPGRPNTVVVDHRTNTAYVTNKLISPAQDAPSQTPVGDTVTRIAW